MAAPAYHSLGVFDPIEAYGSAKGLAEQLASYVHSDPRDSSRPSLGGVTERARAILDHILDLQGATATPENCVAIFISYLVALDCIALADSRLSS